MSNESGQAIIQSQCNTGWVNGSMGTWSHPEPGLWRDENLYSKAFGSFGGVSDDRWNWWPCKIQVQNIAIYAPRRHISDNDINLDLSASGIRVWVLGSSVYGGSVSSSRRVATICRWRAAVPKKTHVTLVVKVTSLLKPVACCIVQSTLVEKWFQNTFGCGHFVGSIIFSDSIIFSPYVPTQIQCRKAMWIYCEYRYICIQNNMICIYHIHIELPLRGSTCRCNCAPWLVGAKAL